MHNGYDIYYPKKKGYDIKVASWKSPVTSQLYIKSTISLSKLSLVCTSLNLSLACFFFLLASSCKYTQLKSFLQTSNLTL